MSMQVLQEKQQIIKARQELLNMGVSSIDSPIRNILRRLRLIRGMAVGDMSKSWDVFATINFLEAHVEKNEPILDIGCYASELIVSMFKLGYTNLTGADLNPDIINMPHQNLIRYVTTDFMHTDFSDSSFKAITSISVIEHGFDGETLLREISRLLKPNGYFLSSFDYWPDKIDTTGTKFFGMDWILFSEEEVFEFVKEASDYGLHPVGEMMCDKKDVVIECGGKKYTFAWLALQKRV